MSLHRGSTGNEARDMDGRESLVEDCLDELFAAYDRGRNDGVANPVAFLIDCEDEIGEPIARAWEGDDVVDGAILANADRKATEGDASTTVLARAFSFSDSCREVPQLFPYLAASFNELPPSGQFLVVAIAFGGAGTFSVPLDSRPVA